MRNFGKRVARLEQWLAPKRRPRVLMRYEGPGSECFPQPTEAEIKEGWPVLTIQFVDANYGRPAES
jgi:hypothetical protein